MDALHLATLIAQGDFGSGFGAGMGAGMGTGVCIGMGAFSGMWTNAARKKLQRQITAAIEAGEISIVDRNGESVTAESLLKLLQERFKKA